MREHKQKTVIVEQCTKLAKNARKHSEAQIKQIMSSIEQFGFLSPIVIDSKGVVHAGNGRLEAARRLGMKEVPAIQAEGLTKDQLRLFALADNRIGETSEWDVGILKEEIDDLIANVDLDMASVGFSDDEILALVGKIGTEESSGINGDPDDIPEHVETRAKLGDLWLLGEHRLLCGDSTKAEDVARLMNGQRASFCFTSPPYANMRDYNGKKDLSLENLSRFLNAPCDLFAVNLGLQRKDGEIIPYWDAYIKQAKEYGLKLLSWNVWNKDLAGSVANQSAMFSIVHEFIFVFGKETRKLNRIFKNDVEQNEKRMRYDSVNLDGKAQRLVRQKDGTTKKSNRGTCFDKKQMGTVVHVTPEMRREYDHPAMFPVELPSIHIISCTDEGDAVYEPFCGSGTTIIACEMTNRRCLGMELDPKYMDIIIARWEKATGKKAVLLEAGNVHNP